MSETAGGLILPPSVERQRDFDLLKQAHHMLRHGQAPKAIPILTDLWDRHPHDSIGTQALYFGALAAYMDRDLPKAIRLLKVVTDLRAPKFAGGHYNMGCFLAEVDEIESAAFHFTQAIEYDPKMAEAYTNLGSALLGMGQIDEALEVFGRGLALNSKSPESRYNRGIAALLSGDYATGWRDYEARWEMPQWVAEHGRDDFDMAKYWDGRPLHGKTLIVAHEQGFGDTMMMLRYGGILRDRKSADVVWLVQPALVRYTEHRDPEARVIGPFDERPDHAAWCTVMSLPWLCGTRKVEDVPKL